MALALECGFSAAYRVLFRVVGTLYEISGRPVGSSSGAAAKRGCRRGPHTLVRAPHQNRHLPAGEIDALERAAVCRSAAAPHAAPEPRAADG